MGVGACLLLGLVGCRHAPEHPFDRAARLVGGAGDRGRRAGRPRCTGWLHRRLRMVATTASSCVRVARAPIPGSPDRNRPGPDRRGAVADPCQGPGPRHPRPARPPCGRGRTGAGWRPPAALTQPACAGSSPPAPGRRPDTAGRQVERQHTQRRLWLAPTWRHGRRRRAAGTRGRPDPAGRLGALTRPTPHRYPQRRPAPSRRLAELARRSLEAGRLPQTGRIRPQLIVTTELDSLLHQHGGLGGDGGWTGALAPQACRRLACDSTLTRVLATRHPNHHHPPGHAPPAAWLARATWPTWPGCAAPTIARSMRAAGGCGATQAAS
jgi:hypothetical protein